MVVYPTPEEKEAWHEREKRHAQRVLLLTVLVFLFNPLTCCLSWAYWRLENVPAAIATNITKYPGAEKIDSYPHWSGSASSGFKYHIYWTKDSADSVTEHYEKFFPTFEQEVKPAVGLLRCDEKTVYLGSHYAFLDMTIVVLEEHSSCRMMPNFYSNVVAIPDDMRTTGTLIVVSYRINELLD